MRRFPAVPALVFAAGLCLPAPPASADPGFARYTGTLSSSGVWPVVSPFCAGVCPDRATFAYTGSGHGVHGGVDVAAWFNANGNLVGWCDNATGQGSYAASSGGGSVSGSFTFVWTGRTMTGTGSSGGHSYQIVTTITPTQGDCVTTPMTQATVVTEVTWE